MASQRLELVLLLILFACETSFAFVSQKHEPSLLARWKHTQRWQHTIAQRSYRCALHATTDSGKDWLAKITPPFENSNGGAPLTTSSDDEDDDQNEPPTDLGNIQIPSTGVSVTDQVEAMQSDKFESELVPITGLPGVAQIVTTANDGIIEPVRYLVSLSPPKRLSSAQEDNVDDRVNNNNASQSFVMVDIPPFSEKLLANMQTFMQRGNKLTAMIDYQS